MKKFKKYLVLCLGLVALSACSSTPSVTELPNTSDPIAEMGRVDNNIKQAKDRQVDVLSPDNFAMATDSMDKAREARGHNKDQKTILHKIALSQAYLDKANGIANVADQVLPGVIAERKNALTAEAPKYFPKEFTDADNDLKDATRDIENSNTASAEKIRDVLQKRYSDVELLSIKKAKLGDAQNTLEQAKKEGAKSLVPQTLTWAEKQMNLDDAAITADRHNTAVVDQASNDAKASSNRLLNLVRQAKSASQENPEQLAKKLEKTQNDAKAEATTSEQKLDQANVELAQSNAKIDSKNGSIAALAAENDKLESKTQLEKRYEAAQAQFTDGEAEVYKQGDKLLLRLKGLSFPKDQAVITPNNYALLGKVQKIIKDNEASSILVEGHTDSTGSKATNEKLSTARAEAVEDYLKANNVVTDDKISAKGFGDSKPIASNKTVEGRAQNRRVDVIITSDQATE